MKLSEVNISLLNILFSHGPVVFFKWLADSNWTIDYVSSNVINLLGYSIDEMTKGDFIFKDIIHPDDLSQIQDEVSKGKNNVNVNITHSPYRIQKKDGTYIWVKDFTSIVYDDHNKPKSFLGYIFDISDTIESEKQLKKNEARLNFALEGSDLGMWDWNIKTGEVFYSPKWKGMLGYEDHEIENDFKEWEIRVHPDDMERALVNIDKVLKGVSDEYYTEHRLKCKDGSYSWILTKGQIVSYDKDGNPERMIGTHSDINYLKSIQEELAHNEKILRTVVNASQDIICLKDSDGRWLLANDRMLDVFEINKDDYLYKTDSQIAKLSKRFSTFCTKCKTRNINEIKEHIRFDETIRISKDEEMVFDIMLIPYTNPDEKQKLLVMIGRDITKIKQTTVKLENSENRLSGILGSRIDLVVRVDKFGNFTYVNDKYCEVFGVNKENILGFQFTPLVHEDDIKPTLKEMEKLNYPPHRCYVEQRALTTEGWRWLAWEDYAILDDNGEIVEIQGVGRDITDKKNYEEKLREIERRYQGIYNNTSDAIFLMKVSGKSQYEFISTNPTHQKLTGISPEMINGKKPEELLPENVAEIVKDNYNKCYLSKKPYTYEETLQLPAGMRTWLTTLIPITNDNGEIYIIAGIARDISDRILIENSLKESELKFRQLAENINQVFWLREKGKMLYISSAYETIWGKSRESIYENAESYFDNIIPEDQEIVKKILNKRERDGDYNSEIVIRLIRETDKSLRWIRMRTFPIKDDNGIVIRHAGIADDITKSKEYEEALKDAIHISEQANKAKSEFLANMSHEIRTPMNSILGFSEILLNTTEDVSKQKHLKTILSSGKTLLTLINDILDLSKIEAGKLDIIPENFSLSQLIEEIRLIFEQKIIEKNLDFIVQLDDNIPDHIFADDVRIRQILVNIVGNAIKFTEAGTIEVTTTLIKTYDNKIDFQIEVADTGIGIPQSEHKKIFESFSQQRGQSNRKYGGTGLGLAISQKLIEMMNGEIHLMSQPDIGSTFTMKFYNIPFTTNVISNYKNGHSFESLKFKGQNILVVDDIRENRELVFNYLQKYNLNIVEAESGETAIELNKNFKFDLILMDIRMGGMTGIEATKIIKNIHPKVDVIAFTASALISEKQKIAKIFDGFLRKPVLEKDLLNEMIKHLDYDLKNESLNKKEKDELFSIDFSAQQKELFKERITDELINKINSYVEILDIDLLDEISDELFNTAKVLGNTKFKNVITELKASIENFDIDNINLIVNKLNKIHKNM